eukprot:141352-Rhodomonas_salina.3
MSCERARASGCVSAGQCAAHARAEDQTSTSFFMRLLSRTTCEPDCLRQYRTPHSKCVGRCRDLGVPRGVHRVVLLHLLLVPQTFCVSTGTIVPLCQYSDSCTELAVQVSQGQNLHRDDDKRCQYPRQKRRYSVIRRSTRLKMQTVE